MKRYFRSTEIIWLIFSILCVGITTYYFIVGDNDNGTFAMVVTLFAGIMYSLRRRFNRHVERVIKREEEKEKNEEKSTKEKA